jgi:hypothetical protein
MRRVEGHVGKWGAMSGSISKVLAPCVVIVAMFVVAVPAWANDSDVERGGACSGRSDWKVKLSEENGAIEVEYEVDQNRVGDVWRVRIRRDGHLVMSGRRRAAGPSGSFEARIVRPNPPGGDVFRARAVNTSTGEVCRGRAVWAA